MGDRIKIAVVDDQPGNRAIMRGKLQVNPHFEICLMAESGKDFLDKMKQLPLNKIPNVVLMDLEMPEMNGVDAVAAGSYLYPGVKFVILTIFDDEETIFKAIKAGAFGYLLKDESAENIAEVLLQMHENSVGPISPGIAYKILQLVQNNTISIIPEKSSQKSQVAFDLTPRETEILKMLVQGKLYKEIGDLLGISPNTAKKHIMNIYGKLHVNNKIQALTLARENGLI